MNPFLYIVQTTCIGLICMGIQFIRKFAYIMGIKQCLIGEVDGKHYNYIDFSTLLTFLRLISIAFLKGLDSRFCRKCMTISK